MALELNKNLKTKSGLSIPTGNIIIASLHFPKAHLSIEENGDLKVVRIITYDMFNYTSVEEVKNGENDNYVQGGVQEFDSGYTKIMTPEEYEEILADGSLAEVWLKNYIDGIMGAGTCTIINPYV